MKLMQILILQDTEGISTNQCIKIAKHILQELACFAHTHTRVCRAYMNTYVYFYKPREAAYVNVLNQVFDALFLIGIV